MLIEFKVLRRASQQIVRGRPIEGARTVSFVKGRYEGVGGSYTGKLNFDIGVGNMSMSLFFYTQEHLNITGQENNMKPDFILINEGGGNVFMYKVDAKYPYMDNDTTENNIAHNRYLISKTIKYTSDSDWINGVLDA